MSGLKARALAAEAQFDKDVADAKTAYLDRARSHAVTLAREVLEVELPPSEVTVGYVEQLDASGATFTVDGVTFYARGGDETLTLLTNEGGSRSGIDSLATLSRERRELEEYELNQDGGVRREVPTRVHATVGG